MEPVHSCQSMLFWKATRIFSAVALLTFTECLPGSLNLETNTFSSWQVIHASHLLTKDPSVWLKAENSPYVFVSSELINEGGILFTTTLTSSPAPPEFRYRFDGFFFNRRIFVVQHKNRHTPIHVSLAGLKRNSQPILQNGAGSQNDGELVFLSDGPEREDDEFVLETPYLFTNFAIIAVLGTKNHLARLRILETPRTDENWLERTFVLNVECGILNQAFIFLKNAVLHQEANFDVRSGCIALCEGSQFVANSNYTAGLQRFFFDPQEGHASLLIDARGCDRSRMYRIVNFPTGSSIKLQGNFKYLRILQQRVIYYFADSDKFITIKFDEIVMQRDKFHFDVESSVLTYEEDAVLDMALRVPCRRFERFKNVVLPYEIGS